MALMLKAILISLYAAPPRGLSARRGGASGTAASTIASRLCRASPRRGVRCVLEGFISIVARERSLYLRDDVSRQIDAFGGAVDGG